MIDLFAVAFLIALLGGLSGALIALFFVPWFFVVTGQTKPRKEQ